MTDPNDPAFELSLAKQRAEKYRQFSVVLEGCVDLLNGEISDEAWQAELAKLAGCDTAAAVWWREKMPDGVRCSVAGRLENSPEEWAEYLEPALSAAQPGQATLIEAIPDTASLLTNERMVFCVEHSPVRYVMIFDHRHESADWTVDDRAQLLKTMKTIAKPIQTRRNLSWLTDVLELTNKFIDSIPRAIFVLTPDGDIFAENKRAGAMLEDSDILQKRDGKLRFRDSSLNAEFHNELAHVLNLPKGAIHDYIWHRNLSGTTGPGSCMTNMLAYPFDNWKLESTARDRVLIMAIQVVDDLTVPTEEQLREFYNLTRSQCRVTLRLLTGDSVEEVANNLHVSVNTVRTHLRAIYSKLEVDNKSELLRRISTTLATYR